MFINKLKVLNKIIYIALFLIAFVVVFASTYNPLNFRRMHVDSSVYVTISQGIIRGQMPYRDFVDNKGPLTYLMSVPGLFLGGFTGIWITEIILYFITVLFAYKTALFFGNHYNALLGTIFTFVVLLSFLFLYAGTEEYSLPFLMISLYIFTKYYFSLETEIKFTELMVLGLCFASAVMIRLNIFPLWAGFCIVIFVETIIKRRFALLGKYVVGFCLGAAIVLLPLYLYLKYNHIFDAFVKQVIIGGASRGFGGSNIREITKNFFSVINRTYCTLPFCLGLYWTIINFKKKYFSYYLAYTVSYLLMILFLSFLFGDYHFNIVLVPFFVPVITFFVDIVHKEFSKLKIRKTVLVLFFCFVLIEGISRYSFNLSKTFFDKSWEQLTKAGRLIDENTKPDDKIISLGFNGYIYPFTKRNAVSKYIFQGPEYNLIPGARDEFLTDVLTNKPTIIAILKTENGIGQIMDDWHAPILEMIDNEYRLLSDENGFNLFIRDDR
jgi:hypothetical protein